MEKEIMAKIDEQDKKLDKIYHSIERMRKYFFWTLIITAITVLLPLVALIFVVPWFLKIITSAYSF